MNDIAKLISGFRDFRRENFTATSSRFQDLVSRGQSPRIMVIACYALDAENGEFLPVEDLFPLV